MTIKKLWIMQLTTLIIEISFLIAAWITDLKYDRQLEKKKRNNS